MKKNKTRTEYLRRINLALEYIEQHLDQDIQLEDVARASHFSPYHFHRLFHAMTGETVNDFIIRRRMEKAAKRLAYKPEMSITDVAIAGGFSSSANFSKAFRLYFGYSPSEMRDPGNGEMRKIGKLFRKYGKAVSPQSLYSQFVTHSGVFDKDKLEEIMMNVMVKEIDEQPVALIANRNGYELESVYATWGRLVQWAVNQGIAEADQVRYAICHDNPSITPEQKCRYEATIVVADETNVTEPYTRSAIPAGKYAVAYFKDTAEKINNFVTELCSGWLPGSGYEPDDFPLMFNYLNDSRKDGYVEMNVMLKVRKLSG